MEPLKDPNSDEFCEWLGHVTKFYLKLGDEQKNEVLNSLIFASGPNQLASLTEMLPNLLFRDFISHLPSELLLVILKHLDGQDLLSCCQVCRCWRDRIDSLVDLWSFKARNLGAVIPSVSSRQCNQFDDPTTPCDSGFQTVINGHENTYSVATLQDNGRMYKNVYVNILKLITGLKSGKSLTIRSDFIHSRNRRINSLMFHGNNIYIGSDNQVQIRSLPGGDFVSSIATHSVCDMIVVHSTIYTASFNANLESWDINTGVGKRTFCGHTSAVLSVDVSDDENFVLTGSVDKTAKLWDQRGQNVELIITMSNVHRDWVFKVKFISCEKDNIIFITCDSSCIQVWTYDLDTRHLDSKGFHAEKGKEFISLSFQQNLSSKFFASAWSETQSMSEFLSFEIKQKRLELKDKWHISGKIKAYILAVGLRFMLIMCSISRKDFLLVDVSRKSSFAQISTPNCLLTRNKSTVTLCDISWLDGFDPNLPMTGLPLFAACVDRHTVMLGLWNAQLKDHVTEN